MPFEHGLVTSHFSFAVVESFTTAYATLSGSILFISIKMSNAHHIPVCVCRLHGGGTTVRCGGGGFLI